MVGVCIVIFVSAYTGGLRRSKSTLDWSPDLVKLDNAYEEDPMKPRLRYSWDKQAWEFLYLTYTYSLGMSDPRRLWGLDVH